MRFSNIAYNLISKYSNFHKHIQCRQTTKFGAQEIKLFHIIWKLLRMLWYLTGGKCTQLSLGVAFLVLWQTFMYVS